MVGGPSVVVANADALQYHKEKEKKSQNDVANAMVLVWLAK